MRISGSFIEKSLGQAEIEISPEELAKQMTVDELLELQRISVWIKCLPPKPKRIEELKGDWVSDEEKLVKIDLKVMELIKAVNKLMEKGE